MRIPPLAFMDNHLERLAAELKAIELWDEIYISRMISRRLSCLIR